MVRACKEYLHTGKVVLRDQQRCHDIMAALIAGVPVTSVMRRFKVGYQSIRRIETELEAAGKLESLKQREQRQLMQLGALARERLTQRIIAGSVPDNVNAVIMGISYQRAGEMGSDGTEPDAKGEQVGDPDDWARRFEEAKRVVEAAPIDVQTTDTEADSQ